MKLLKQTCQAISYSQNMLTFLFLNKQIVEQINTIYLYGSAVRGELTKTSDIDLFIDCMKNKEETIKKHFKESSSNFYNSKDYEKWKQFKFTYPFGIEVGQLEKWELKTSIEAEGLLLYSKKSITDLKNKQIIITLKLPKEKKKYLSLIRFLFGRNENKFQDKGLIRRLGGKKLSSNIIIVPYHQHKTILTYFHKNKIDYSLIEIALI